MTPAELMDICRWIADRLTGHAGKGRDPGVGDAEDLAQEGALQVWRRGLINADEALVYVVARNAMIDHLRSHVFGFTTAGGRMGRDAGTVELDELRAKPQSYDPTRDWDDALECGRILQQDLTPTERILLSTYTEQVTLSAIAARLGTYKEAVFRMRRKLIRRLRETA